jgi:DNA-directed RNA polymerase subunit beta'
LFSDIEEGVTVTRYTDEITGLTDTVIMDPKQRPVSAKDMRPIIKLVDAKGDDLKIPGTDHDAHYLLPPKAIINVSGGEKINIGDVIARIPQESSKTRDITGGLPRVAELFEARSS